MRRVLWYLFALALLAGAPRDAHAYLDPGTGSMLLQGALAALFGAAFTLRMYWGRVKQWLGLVDEDDDAPEVAPE